MNLSVVTTLYKSADNILEFYERISTAVSDITNQYEIIFVNDGSPDNVLEICRNLQTQDSHLKLIDLSRNFGHHKAIMTGLHYTSGDYVFLIDSDLEEPPEMLSIFYDHLQKHDVDVVYGVQQKQTKGFFYKLFRGWFYTLFNLLSDVKLPRNLLTIRLMSRRYINELLNHREQVFVIAGLWAITGFSQISLPVYKRNKKTTTYNFARKISHMLFAITAFSQKPLIYIAYLGLFITVPTGLLIVYYVTRFSLSGIGVDGFTSLIVSIWFLGGLNIFALGILAIYLSVIFIEVKDRPYTVVRRIYPSIETDLVDDDKK